jgi:UDP-N-acetylenolpyruvoylglucosamine reductase
MPISQDCGELADCTAVVQAREKPLILGNGSNVLAPTRSTDGYHNTGVCGIKVEDGLLEAECARR